MEQWSVGSYPLSFMEESKKKLTHLDYLRKQTKSDPGLMVDLISIYLDQTAGLITAMKNGLEGPRWQQLKAAAHKIIPSFRILGIDDEYADIPRKIEVLSANQQSLNEITGLVAELEQICSRIFSELKDEVDALNRS